MFRSLKFFFSAALLIFVQSAFAQNVTGSLQDKDSREALGFATVSLYKDGQEKPIKYSLSDDKGVFSFSDVRKGSYSLKAELLGYKALSKTFELKDKTIDLGVLSMEPDMEQLEAAKVTATGNPIVVKKDTIEFNASSFKTTENDALEDLLKKLPGVEVSEDGSITVNGEAIKKITINGKTFFMDDPQLASKNLPAKIVNKLKVIEKKSDQAEFTGIDDGETETIIDLSIMPHMMRGAFGNLMAGGGHDIMPELENYGDWRFQGAGFLGRFTDESQISLVVNGNNTNNRGFNDLAGSMMQGMRGGGGGMGRGQGGWGGNNGITTSYMIGTNGAFSLLDGDMDLTGNYLYNHTNKDVEESSLKRTYLDDHNLFYNTQGMNYNVSGGNRFGVRLEHKFSENANIVFEPQVNFGSGSYFETSTDTTYYERADGSSYRINDAHTDNSGANKNVSTSGFGLYRQRLGAPGRTLTVMGRYSLSNNRLEGINSNGSVTYNEDGTQAEVKSVDQTFNNVQNSYSLMGRVTYTEPLGSKFFLEANYSYNWNKSTSDKKTYEADGTPVAAYSNEIINESHRQDMGANLKYQAGPLNAQVGFSAKPTRTINITSSRPEPYNDFRWNFSPQAMIFADFSETSNGRLFYYGNSAQPSTSQLMPVPDNTNPLNISFGNPTLTPYFTHNIRGDWRYNNKKTFFSANIRFNGSFVQNPIVNAMWYNGGAQYSMPANGPASGNTSVNAFINAPIAKSKFSINTMTRANYSRSASFVGANVDMSGYADPSEDYYSFMNAFIADRCDASGRLDLVGADDFTLNTTKNLGITERLRVSYRGDNLEVTASGRTRVNHSWYTIAKDASNTTTWNNQINATCNWTWEQTGITFKSEYQYNWYRGYSTAQPSEHILNAELQKSLFEKKFTLALKGYDILGQSKNLMVTDSANYHQEVLNNTLGRYIILSLTYRFGNFNNAGNSMRGPMGGGRPPMR
ncbi:MAG: outer membrane beta-barrel protein [Bacteroidales bacterium]|nr:outer membrane beta-barrel protein [Candidatus Cryptobacteroides aphodequi]